MFGVDVVGDCPGRQLVPLVHGAAVHGQPQLQVDVLPVIQLLEHLLHDVGEVLPVDHVVRLHEDLPQPRLADGVILGVELVKSVESISVL